MIGTRRNSISQQQQQQQQQRQQQALSKQRVPHQILRRPIKSRNTIQQPAAVRAHAQTLKHAPRMPSVKSTIWDRNNKPHVVKPRTFPAASPGAPPVRQAPNAKGRGRQLVAPHPRQTPFRPVKTAGRTSVVHAPRPPLHAHTGKPAVGPGGRSKVLHRYERSDKSFNDPKKIFI